MIADGRVGVYLLRVPNNGGSSAARGTLQAWPLSVPFPSKDESWGCVFVAWHRPPYASRLTWMYLSLLWDYLAGSAASPLQLAFIENDDLICTDLGPVHDVFTEGYHQLWIQEVDVDRMDKVVDLGGQRWRQRWGGGGFRPVEDAHCCTLTMTAAKVTAAAAATAAASVAAVVVTADVERADVATAAVVMVTVAMAVMTAAATATAAAAATTTGRGNRGCSVSVGRDSFDDCSGNNDVSENSDGLHRQRCWRRLQQ